MTLENLFQEASTSFTKLTGNNPTYASGAPGRINIIGEHTDYNEGLSMPAGINRWVVTVGKERKDKKFSVYSRDFDEKYEFDLDDKTIPEKTWKKFVCGAVHIFSRTNAIPYGMDFYIMGNIPVGSGVSSSAGLSVSVMNFLRAAYKSPMTNLEAVKACQKIEHEFLKVKSGILDQYASQFSRKDNLMVLDFKIPSHEYIEISQDNWIWILCDTKVKRELSGSKYSERVQETSEGFQKIKSDFPDVSHMRDINLSHLSKLDNKIIYNRLKHYVEENARVYEAVKVLKKNDMKALGKLLNDSHASLRDLYEVSCEELDFLAATANDFNGCAGSRMMGGGFGGCTINLVAKDKAEEFKKYISEKYLKKFNIQTECHVYEIVDGAFGGRI